MPNFHFQELVDLYASKSRKALVEAIQSMDNPVYPHVEHVPVLVIQTGENGGDRAAAEKCLDAYFKSSVAQREILFSR